MEKASFKHFKPYYFIDNIYSLNFGFKIYALIESLK